MILLSQIAPLRAKCLHLICGVPETLAVKDYSCAFRALHLRQIHFVKYPGQMFCYGECESVSRPFQRAPSASPAPRLITEEMDGVSSLKSTWLLTFSPPLPKRKALNFLITVPVALEPQGVTVESIPLLQDLLALFKQHYEWFFSGAGIVIIGFLGRVIFRQKPVIQTHHHYDGDSSEALKSYLQWEMGQTNHLPLGKISMEHASPGRDQQITLSQVYTHLDTLEPQKSGCEADIRECFSDREKEGRVSCHDMVNQERYLILLGDPGSGKTTVVNYVCHVMAKARLDGWKAGSELLKDALGWENGPHIPVRIVLREFGEWFPSCEYPEAAVEQWIKRQLDGKGMSRLADDFFAKVKNPKEPMFIVFDGLDEVPVAVRKDVSEAISNFSEGDDGNHYLVTSRIYAYTDADFQLPHFKGVVLAPFSKDQIHAFIDSWYSALDREGQGENGNNRDGAGIFKQAIGQRDLMEMAENPLIMTVMALLHTSVGQLPEDRVELYKWATDLLFRRWKARDEEWGQFIRDMNVQGLKIQELRDGLDRVAYEIHKVQGDKKGPADISADFLLKNLKPYLGNDWGNVQRFLDFIRERSGLLIRHREEQYTFPHRTFQEYMAACHLVSREEYAHDAVDRVRENDEVWKVVFPLAAGQAARSGQLRNAIHSAEKLISKGKTSQTKTEARHAIIAGEAVKEIGINAVAREDQSFLDCIRKRLVSDMVSTTLSPSLRVESGNVLAALGDPRFDSDGFGLPKDDDLGFVYIPDGTFEMGSDPEKDENETVHEVTLSEYWLARFPVTVDQYLLYLRDSGEEKSEDWEQYNRVGNHPVVEVSWHDAGKYCNWLTRKLKDKGWAPKRKDGGPVVDFNIILPTEAQWEYGARGDDGRIYPWGDKIDPERANYGDGQISGTSPVGVYPKGLSFFELADMSGNVWEWCKDESGKSGEIRALRGGAWDDSAGYCRAAQRDGIPPELRYYDVGFRLACQVRA